MSDLRDKSPFGFDPREMENWVLSAGHPRYRARQLCNWLYRRHVIEYGLMLNLPAGWRGELEQRFGAVRIMPEREQVSVDGVRKLLFRFGGRKLVEAALIPDRQRLTLCLSTQAGCARSCRFCRTGRQGLQGSLTSGEILTQYASAPRREEITNIVYMGMGEPFDNTGEVLRSLRVFTAAGGYALSPRRVTVSTVGIRPGLDRFLAESDCHLAVSLHTPFSRERRFLVPAEENFPLDDIVDLLRQYDFSGQRRLTFEIVMLAGINDTPEHARATVRLLNGLPCRVNLIPYHEAGFEGLVPSVRPEIEKFRRLLERGGLRATIRASRGEDIGAACGLLSTSAGRLPGPVPRHGLRK